MLQCDLSSYFDTIPHDKLMIVLKQRIADPRILDLIEKWLKCPVYEDAQFKGGKKNKAGTPQGGVISPLLANIYMHLVDKMVNNIHQLFYKQGIKIVRYADDFVILCKTREEALKAYAMSREFLEKNLKNYPGRSTLKITLTEPRQNRKISLVTLDNGFEMNDELIEFLDSKPELEVQVQTL